MNTLRIALLLLLMGGASLGMAQGLKVGFVNTAKILDEAPQAQNARRQLEREFSPRDRGLTDAERSLQQLEDRLQRDGQVMSEAQRRQLERDILTQRRDLARSVAELRDDLNLRRNEELSKLQQQVRDAILAVAREQRFDLVLNDIGVIYAADTVDITDQVLRRLR